MVRKIVAAVFIAVLMFNAVGAYLVLESMRYGIRKEVKKRIKGNIPECELHVLQFSKAELASGNSGIQWIHKNEFRYNDKMYDIVRKSVHDGRLVLMCINDREEEQLFAGLDALVNDLSCKDPKARSHSKTILQMLTQVLFQHAPTFHFGTDLITSLEYGYALIPLSCECDVPSPPPWDEA